MKKPVQDHLGNTAWLSKDWCDEFISELNRIAAKWNMTLEAVAKSWQEYALSCTDQSALVFEFEQWVDRVERAKAIIHARKGR